MHAGRHWLMFYHWLCALRALLLNYHVGCDARSGIALVSFEAQADVSTPGDAPFPSPLSSIFCFPASFIWLCRPLRHFLCSLLISHMRSVVPLGIG
ncbi:hypothetical protein LZ32DRAFT_237144 [Colletotrichum eremochloae]|nr:hypothetical protein LZ32DRAFT_237144 [Colletotrichum eremochloae]